MRHNTDQLQHVRVLLIDHTAQMGGGEIALRNLLQHLDTQRFRASVLLCGHGPLTEQLRAIVPVYTLPLAERVSQTRKEAVGWRSLLRLKDLLALCAFIWQMSRVIKTLEVDVVHTNSLKAHLIGGIAGRIARRPVIWHMRDRIVPEYLPSSAVRMVCLFSRFLPTVIIANSRATLSTIEPRRAGKLTSRVSTAVVHDGCELPPLSEPIQSRAGIRMVLIGRISPWKGQHIFIRAASIVHKEFPEVHFQIVGAPLFAETEYESELKTLTRSLDLESALTFTGFVADVYKLLQDSDIVVHASTVGEPFGQVVIEGMAAAKPVIATRGGGIVEIVEDGVSGLLVTPGDELDLAKAMIALLRNPAAARAMGAEGRERVRRFFTLDRTARGVEAIYEQLAGSRGAALNIKGASLLPTAVHPEQ